MKAQSDWWKNLWQQIRAKPSRLPSRITIADDHVDKRDKIGQEIKPDELYFQVRVNEMYLANSREWFTKYDPMVLVVSEFIYDKETVTVPFVVGPMILEKLGQNVPAGMIFSDTRVAGLHPYRGGRLNLSVILSRIERKKYPKKILQIIENVSNALDFATEVNVYIKMADVILGGVEDLLSLDGSEPIGLRKEFDPDAGDVLEPKYFALIDKEEGEIKEDLWVIDNKLHVGESIGEAKPFREADFVLYSITGVPERSDETTLPFYPIWERVVEEASKIFPQDWENTKTLMNRLHQKISLSSDLTKEHGRKLVKNYIAEMKSIHDQAVEISDLGPEDREPSELDEISKKSSEILKM